MGAARMYGAAVGLALCASASSAQVQAEPLPLWRYQVQPGDTLIGIGRQWLQQPERWRELQRINRVREPRRLQPGRAIEIPEPWLRRSATTATLSSVVGAVWRVRTDGSLEPLPVGATVSTGDQLRTDAGASATVRFSDGSEVELAGASAIALRDVARVLGAGADSIRLELSSGEATSRVRTQAPRPRYEMRTPSLTLGARGTAFRAGTGAEGDRAEVVEGRVAAAGALVAAGQGVVARDGRVSAPIALPPAPDLSAVPARAERVPLRLGWAPMPEAAGWRAQVRSAPDGAALLLDGRFDRPQASWADLPDGDYVLRVRAVGPQGLEGRDADHRFTLKARPEPPPTQAPPPGARAYGERVVWRWAVADGLAGYRLQVAATPDFAAPVIDVGGLSGPSTEQALPPGVWHWRMASVRPGNDQGPWGDAQRLELRPEPAAPAAEPQAADGRLALRWSAREPGDRYRVQVARDAAFADRVADRELDEPTLVLEGLAAGTYHVRLRTLTADGHAGPWGPASRVEMPLPRWMWLLPALLLVLL